MKTCRVILVTIGLVLLVELSHSQISFSQSSAQAFSQSQGGGIRVNIIFDDSPTFAQDPSCLTSDQRPGTCKSLAECAIFFAEIPNLLQQICKTGRGQDGVCCPVQIPRNDNTRNTGGVLQPPPPPPVAIPKIPRQQLLLVVSNSIRAFNERQTTANRILFEDQIQIPRGTPAASHQRLFTTTNEILDQGNNAQLNIEASTGLLNDLNLSKLQGTFGLPHVSARNTPIANTCPPVSQCIPGNPYRTIDGSCNNERNPDWGKAGTAFQRILAPKYGDGVSSPRTKGVGGGDLPSPRLISSRAIPDQNRPYSNITLMLMQWGQFLDHDLTHTPIVKGPNQTSISCCNNGQPLEAQFRHPDCFPIDIPRDDSFFSTFGQVCMELVRSLPAPRRECNFGPREQMSQITSFLDGSNIYGSTDTKAKELREGQRGRLKAQQEFRSKRDLLPANPSQCSDAENRRFCFSAGDARVNEQLDLAVMHTVWLREHNRVAEILSNINPNWADETVYQETRRIVIAEMQHITYNEFLPLVLGPEYTRTFSLNPLQSGHTTLYNPELDPSITNVFATAAYRFGHSLVQGLIQSFTQFGDISADFSLVRTQFQPFPVYDNLDSLIRGLTSQECQRFDNFLTDSLTKHLFQGSSSFGLDLAAINIQRGRDHGLPPYNDWRQICGLPRLNSWLDLFDVMNPEVIQTLEGIYDSVDDIDLFMGGLGERPIADAILGPVFVCLVGDQFARLRRGDRFFYEEPTSRFTRAQLDQIRKVSLARVLCDNSDDITVIQPLVMQKADILNRRLPCSKDIIPAIDFTLWKEFRPSRTDPGFVQRPPQQSTPVEPSTDNFQRPPDNFAPPQRPPFSNSQPAPFVPPQPPPFTIGASSPSINFGPFQNGRNNARDFHERPPLAPSPSQPFPTFPFFQPTMPNAFGGRGRGTNPNNFQTFLNQVAGFASSQQFPQSTAQNFFGTG